MSQFAEEDYLASAEGYRDCMKDRKRGRVRYFIIMSSAAYGSEEFEYSTERERQQGLKRLSESIARHMKVDGIERSLILEDREEVEE